MNELSYIDLFSGIGGFHLGLLQAGFKFNWTGFSEIDKYAKKVYQNHFPESEDLGDVRGIQIRCLDNKPIPLEELNNENEGGDAITEVRTATRTIRFKGKLNLVTFGFP